MDNIRLYFRFIQFSLGLYEGKEFLSGDALEDFDWNAFYCFCRKQTLEGVAFEGIQRLSKKHAPSQGVLMKWFGLSQMVCKRNFLMNKATAHVYKKINDEGFRCCILKGQGNALMYSNPASRTPGDVDVWVNAGRDDIGILAKSLIKEKGYIGDECYNHIELVIDRITIELHSTPVTINNPILNHRMQRWFKRNADLQCSNLVDLPDDTGQIAIPTTAFNAIYQLGHLHHHFFYEGVGLRQIIDYYFVLNSMDSSEFAALQRDLKYLGLWSFAGAVMYVLHEVLGFAESKIIVPMDAKRGKLLLEEILSGGNFGQYDNRRHFGRGTIGHNLQRIQRDLRLLRYYPAEALAEPFFRVWHFFWRLKNKV